MKNHRERIVDANAADKTAIRCKVTGRLNARQDDDGLYVFCRQCNAQHLYSWNEIEEMRKERELGHKIPTIYI
jgi:hypothetical protein